MIKIKQGDIVQLNDVEAIVNASNGVGIMGKGVAGAISKAAGSEVTDEARRICRDNGNFEAGSCFKTTSAELANNGVKAIYHAVTMKYPGTPTSIDIISKAMRSTIEQAVADGIKSIAFPGLGNGIGGLDDRLVARRMVDICLAYHDSIDITIIGYDKNFVKHLKDSMNIS